VQPAENLRDAYRAADPRPLDGKDPYLVDLTKARDSKATEHLRQMIENCGDSAFSAIAFSGHRGSGKSTELKRLQESLSAHCYTLYLDVNDFLDAADVDYTDLFLLISRRLLDQLRDDGVAINGKLLKAVEEWFVSVTKETEESVKLSAGVSTEAKAGVEIPFIAKLLAKLTADVKAGSSSKVATRAELDRYFSALLNNTNLLLDAACEALKGSGKASQILVVIDNLDRVPPKKSEDLFFAHGSQLHDLHCHAVYTISIDTFYSHKGIANVFPNHVILPNVKLRTGKASLDRRKEGFDALWEVVARRVSIEKLVPQPDVVDRIIEYNGGSVRQLVRLMSQAILSSQSDGKTTLDRESVDDAITALRLDFERILSPGDYNLLARVARSKRIEKDEQHMRLLSNTATLEYNGKDVWHDVNPLIEPIDAFKAAKQGS
jgi:hypothetical protein